MNKINTKMYIIDSCIVILLLVITISGVLSFRTEHAYEVINSYGDTVQIWGTGLYAHDSYFKAPIFIGSDAMMLIIVIPCFVRSMWKLHRCKSLEYQIEHFAILSVILYYSTSIAFGVMYNALHLLYVCLFSMSLFSVAYQFLVLYKYACVKEQVCEYRVTSGMKYFMIIAGISLFVAWLPDILISILNGTSLGLIEIYTTEITYVLDMGIISPLCFLTIYLSTKKKFSGFVLMRMLFQLCVCVGIMIPLQTCFQLWAGITIPLPALITKGLIFVLMAVFAAIFEYRLKHEVQYHV